MRETQGVDLLTIGGQRLGPDVSALALGRPPTARAGGADAEALGCLSMGRTSRHSLECSLPQSTDKEALGMYADLRPAHSLNQLFGNLGIPIYSDRVML